MNILEHKPSEVDAERCLRLRKLSQEGVKLNKEDHTFIMAMMDNYLEWFLETSVNIIKGNNVMNDSNNKIGITRVLEIKPELIDSAIEYLMVTKKVYDSYKEAAKIAIERYNNYIEAEKVAYGNYSNITLH